MRRPEEVQRDLVRQWIAKADEDLDTAVFLLKERPQFGAVIGVSLTTGS